MFVLTNCILVIIIQVKKIICWEALFKYSKNNHEELCAKELEISKLCILIIFQSPYTMVRRLKFHF